MVSNFFFYVYQLHVRPFWALESEIIHGISQVIQKNFFWVNDLEDYEFIINKNGEMLYFHC